MKKLCALFLLVLLCGCAAAVDKIDIPYKGEPNGTVVNGADKISVTVLGEDKRTILENRVSVKKNSYGMELAAIEATNDLAKTFADAVSDELANEGFKIRPDAKSLHLELVRFYNDFKTGFFSGDAVADGRVNIRLYSKTGALLYANTYEGGGTEPNIQFASGGNARAALMKAMAAIVSKVAQDKALQSALLKNP